MKAFNVEKGKIDLSSLNTTASIVHPIVNPRLMRVIPSNISRVIGNFDEVEADTNQKL